jgi:hypothetical protein
VSEGTAAVDVAAGRWVVAPVSLEAGRRPDVDGDGVPDAVDQCPGDRTTFGACPAGDGGADVLPPGEGPAADDAAIDGAAADVGADAPADVSRDLPAAEAASSCGPVLLVVGGANLPSDNAIAARLAQLTCVVTTVDDSLVAMADGNGKSLTIISETAVASMVAGKLKALTGGVMDMQPQLLDDMSFTGHTQATDWDMGAMESMVSIINPAHPLAAGLSGSLPIFTAVANVGWGTPDSPAAIKVVAFPAAPTRFLVFGYEKGAAMSLGSTAPGRRVAFLASRDAVLKLNASGWALFDAAVRWASGN